MGVSLRALAVAVALLGAASIAGCMVEDRPARVGGPVMVDSAPPPERVEVQPPRPGARYVFVHGHWHHNGRGWLWIPGHWDAVRPGYHYVPGHWAPRGRRWIWSDGYWRRS